MTSALARTASASGSKLTATELKTATRHADNRSMGYPAVSSPRAPANILLVDDRADNLALLQTILAPLGENLVLASSGERALREMLRVEFALVILDVRMPDMDGYEAATIMKSRERTRHVPIIFLTGLEDTEAARRGYGIGAVDYLFKPFDPVILTSKVSVFVDLFHLKREAQELAHRALHDPLTGLPNRTLFGDRLGVALARSLRTDSFVAVFYIDLDGFKPVNDTHGHDVGDALLRMIAANLRSVLRPADTVARLGGDEFALLFDAIDSESRAEKIALRIVEVVESTRLPDGPEVQVSASVGVALTPEPMDGEALLRAADAAMYEAKGVGGRTARVRDPLAGPAVSRAA